MNLFLFYLSKFIDFTLEVVLNCCAYKLFMSQSLNLNKNVAQITTALNITIGKSWYMQKQKKLMIRNGHK